ncbi:hypothetical protein [Nocardia sp. NPDC020380]|uniref:hypothetical protein n=1 Tax=Nocardia sp. NPDC020380 TaxID=3364309 RepID=UPI00378EE323
MSSIQLWFPLTEVVVLADHAMAAPEHTSSPYGPDDAPAAPALVWVKDDGTYLMSNGRPRQLADPSNPTGSSRVVYAHGWGSGTGPMIGDSPVGGDDFAEYITLTEQFNPTNRIIDLIRKYAPRDGWMVLTVKPGQFEISFTLSHPH